MILIISIFVIKVICSVLLEVMERMCWTQDLNSELASSINAYFKHLQFQFKSNLPFLFVSLHGGLFFDD